MANTERDFTIANHGSVVILTPENEYALAWAEEHLEPGARWGACGFVIEPRYIPPILEGLQADGFTW